MQSALALKDVFPALLQVLPKAAHRGDGCRRQIRRPKGMAVPVQEHIVAILSLLDESKFGNDLSQPQPSLFQASHPFCPQALHTAWRPPKDRKTA